MSAKTRRAAAYRSPRGTNALIIEEILKGMAPSAVRPAEIDRLRDGTQIGRRIRWATENRKRRMEGHKFLRVCLGRNEHIGQVSLVLARAIDRNNEIMEVTAPSRARPATV